jgi:hypothetical protein
MLCFYKTRNETKKVKIFFRLLEKSSKNMKKLRLCPTKEGKKLNGKGTPLHAANITHDQAQAFSNQGHAKWFIWCDAANHPNESERPQPATTEQPVKESAPKPKRPGKEFLNEANELPLQTPTENPTEEIAE